MTIPSLSDLNLEGQRVFIRVDFNVPLDGTRITDDTRIRAALPTIKAASEAGGRLVLASHLGRPKGERVAALSIEPAAQRLAELLPSGELTLADDCIGDGARKVVGDLRDGQVAVLENLRFHPGEEENDETFARELAKLADVYVNDAFGAAHRKHASVHALPGLLRERCAGKLLLAEVEALRRLREDPERPYVAVLGGAKVSGKLPVLEALLGNVDAILIGGAMANTFLAASGCALGKSLVEDDKLALARSILQKATEKDTSVVLPVDLRVGDSTKDTTADVVSKDAVPASVMALDIGPETAKLFDGQLERAGTVFWNGPMGLFENPAFAEGTLDVARSIARAPGFTVVGGGDSVAAVKQAKLDERFGHVSTGGGASLEYMEGKKLPGIEALRQE